MKRCMLTKWQALIASFIVCFSHAGVFAAPGDIKITEVMFNATYDDVWEWIEITNTGGSPINMDGYYAFPLGQNDILDTANGGLGPSPSILSSLDPDTTINPGETMILYDAFYAAGNTNNFQTDTQFRSAWSMSPTTKVLGLQFWPTLGNTTGGNAQTIGFWNDRTSWRADMTPTGGGTGAEVTGFANSQFYLDFRSYPATATVNGNSSITWTGNGSNHDGTKWVQSVTGVNGAVTSVVAPIGTGSDIANPGIVSNVFGAAAPGLYFTEIMFDPSNDTTQPIGEWVELYNNTGAAINLAGYVLDDKNNVSAATGPAGNIASGIIPAGGVAILYPENLITAAEFEATWGPGLNLIGVSNWTTNSMSLNNSVNATTDPNNPFYQINDSIALWSSYAANQADLATYTPPTGPVVNYNSQASAIAKQAWGEGFNGFPGSAVNASIHLADPTVIPSDGDDWSTAAFADQYGSFQSGLRHPGGDVGSPGTFVVIPDDGQPGDFDDDGDVDGRDFLIWQRGGSPGGVGDVSDLADWQANYGTQPPLTATTAVPEPASLAMLALALVPMVCGRKR